LTLAAVTPALAQNRPFDPRDYQTRHVGEPTQILVIATPHLSGAPDSFDPAVLEPLLQRLEAFHPDAIAIEALPGRSIDQMWNYRESYPDTARSYGGRALALAGLTSGTLGMDMPQAEAEMRRTLAAWPASPTAAQRRRLTALFIAAGDPWSALVQWWKLDPSERIADESISRVLAEQLQTYDTVARRNENHLIASRLAVRLGHERVWSTDDQSDDVVPGFEANMTEFMDEPWMAALNMINRASPGNVGRARVAAWETRNLRQAANIREVSARYPGGRILVIVGSAHKPWFDAYLSMMSDVQIVDATRVLR
jgi:hypothetical protein